MSTAEDSQLPVAPVDSILFNEELDLRPSRPADFQRESAELLRLARALADDPNSILQVFVEAMLNIFQADSAGISLLTDDGQRFYWPAIAGVWTNHIGGGTPRDFGPCGDVLDRDCPLFFKHVEKRYTYFSPVTPLVQECLLVPFYFRGSAVGTIWIVLHEGLPHRRLFDREDRRLLISLSSFAAAAYQSVLHSNVLRQHAKEKQTSSDVMRDMNEALLVASVRQHELTQIAEDAEAALRASENRFHQLFDTAQGGIVVLDAETHVIVDANVYFGRLLGKEIASVRGKTLSELNFFVSDSDFGKALAILSQAGHLLLDTLQVIDSSGRIRDIELNGSLHMEGDCRLIQLNLRDISDRKQLSRDRDVALEDARRARLDAESADSAKDSFLAVLSHELRTPLTAILGWTLLLRREEASREEIDDALEVIERNARAQERLIEDVLDVARILSGKFTVDRKPCDLMAIVRASVDSVRLMADAKSITLNMRDNTTTTSGSLLVFGDAIRLQQSLTNLLANAMKFTPKAGQVSVEISRTSEVARVTISDSGLGISALFLPHVFDRFTQADGGSTRGYGGLGLGLSIVRQIVELHGGTIHAASEGTGKGSTFSLELPLQAQTSAAPAPSQAIAPVNNISLTGVRVLVVDDDFDARLLVKKLLESVGASVAVADSASAGFEAARTALPPFHVLISDLGMAVEDGFSFVRRLRGSGTNAATLPAIAFSAFVSPKDRKLAFAAGFQEHIPKPLDPDVLLSAVHRWTSSIVTEPKPSRERVTRPS